MAAYLSRPGLEVIDVIDAERRPRVLMVVANPGTSGSMGWPVGFWASELFHPFYEFMQKLYEITVASPDGGPVIVDAWSDPRDPSGYSSEDLVSMGALNTHAIAALLESTPAVSHLDLDGFDALLICGGQGPMWQDFRNRGDLKDALLHFYLAHKVTATLCHGTSALLDVQLPDGSYLIEGKTITGFTDDEEDYADAAAGKTMMPFRIEDAANDRGANFIQAGRFKGFAVRDGNLITGQQQFSGRQTAELMITALGG
jgi:putative intracellular protease/amidase